jgi:hypothetical protein
MVLDASIVGRHASYDLWLPNIKVSQVFKRGSHLCAANYCRRYRR